MKLILQKIGMLIAMLLSSLSAYAYDFEVDGIYYNLNVSTKTATVTYRAQFQAYHEGEIIIPSVVNYMGNEIPVTAIGSCAFYGSTAMTSITLPQSIVQIYGQAFEDCSGLKSIVLPDSLRSIGNSAFSGCASLQLINIPKNITSLNDYIFRDCISLEAVDLPDEFEILPRGLFNGCKSLKTINLPKKLRKIESSVFAGCKALESVEFNDVLESIGDGAFIGCSGLTSLELPNTISQIGTSAFENCVNLSEITLPDRLETIAIALFKGCKSLASLIIPQNVEKIEKEAFSGCESLLELSIPASVKKIESNGMDGAYFKNIIFEDSPNSISIPNYAWDRKYQIGNSYFSETIYEYCKFPSTLTDLYIGRDIIIDIGYSGYNGKTENAPFYNCTNLNNISIGSLVSDLTTLSTSRYEDLDSLILTCCQPPTIKPFTADQYLIVKVKVLEEALEAYRQADVWKDFWNLEGFEYSEVDDIKAEQTQKSVTGWYDLNGRTVSKGYKGLVIVRFSDGSCKKMLNR